MGEASCRPGKREAGSGRREAGTAHQLRELGFRFPLPPSRFPLPALPAWRKQRQRQNHFLRRHAAVKERSAIPALVLAQLGRVDEETIVGRQQSISTRPATWQTQHILVREQERLVRALGAKILAELVSQIGARIPLGVNSRGSVAVDRAVIRRKKYGDLPPGCFLEHAEQRRSLEPLSRYLPKGDFVPRNFVQYL